MAGERLPAWFLLRRQLWFRWTGKCFETATSHMQTVSQHWGDSRKEIQVKEVPNFSLSELNSGANVLLQMI